MTVHIAHFLFSIASFDEDSTRTCSNEANMVAETIKLILYLQTSI